MSSSLTASSLHEPLNNDTSLPIVRLDFDAKKSSVTERLESARKDIHDAVESILRSMSSDLSFSGITGEDLDRNDGRLNKSEIRSFNLSHEEKMDMWLRPPSTSKELFEMGTSIFEENIFIGDESVIQMKLEQVESKLRQIITTYKSGPNISDENDTRENVMDEYNKKCSNDVADPIEKTIEETAMDIDDLKIDDDKFVFGSSPPNEEAVRLSSKVKFLKSVVAVKKVLDESMNSAPIDTVNSVKLLLNAEKMMVDIKNMVQSKKMVVIKEQQTTSSSTPSSSPVHKSKELDLKFADRVLNSVLSQISHQRFDLCTRARSILDASLFFSTSDITVKKQKQLDGMTVNQNNIGDIFDVFMALSNEDNNVLEDIIYNLSARLFNIVLRAILECDADANNSNERNISFCEFHEIISDESNVDCSDSRSPIIDLNDGIKYYPVAALKWSKCSKPPIIQSTPNAKLTSSITNLGVWTEKLQSVQKILDFLHTHVFAEKKHLCSMVGDYLYVGISKCKVSPESAISIASLSSSSLSSETEWEGPLLKQLLGMSWDICIPSLPAELHDVCTKLKEIAKEFETNLVKKGFLKQQHETSSGLLPLSCFATNLEKKYAEKRRSSILVQGRNILLKEDFHNTIIVGTESKQTKPLDPSHGYDMNEDGQSVFLLHKCCVSQVAASIMKLCRETLDEAVSPQSLVSLSPHLYRSARELFNLYRAIIPSLHGSAIKTIPRAAAILHNDCIYFAHTMLTLGHEYRERSLPGSHELLKKMCTFVDLVPVFREVGERALVDTIERQKHQLANLVYERVCRLKESLRKNDPVDDWQSAETSVRAADYHLRHLATAWRNVLSIDLYGRSMGSIVDTLFSILLEQVLNAVDISETASHFVSGIFSDAMKCSELFIGGEHDASQYCHLWERFNVVRKFMDMSLSNITMALSRGEFRSVTGPELSQLICAVFSESKDREKILLALKSSEQDFN